MEGNRGTVTRGVSKRTIKSSPQERTKPKTQKRMKFGERIMFRQQRMAKEFKEQPRDVRWFTKLMAIGAVICSLIALEYTRFRAILNNFCAGTCSSVHKAERKQLCSAECKWHYIDKGHEFCRGCDCPAWSGSQLGVKLSLARFKCPLQKFGREQGWFGRLFSPRKTEKLAAQCKSQCTGGMRA